MNHAFPPPAFRPTPADSAGVLSWAHLGDLHMTVEGEQNHHDLRAIVAELQGIFAASLSFVFLPGDIADDGSHPAYAVVRRSLDPLHVPWCAILGDHDVHEKSFGNFLDLMSPRTHYAFTVGNVRFLAMNAFDVPDPGSFAVLPQQLEWCEQELMKASGAGHEKVLFLHCYPSELKVGAEHLEALIRRYSVRLVEMGHTHYNELANDGRTLYSATRSTGQVEEGLVGFSVTNFDRGFFSWKFLELGALPAVIITSPGDKRLLTDAAPPLVDRMQLPVRAKVWARSSVQMVSASFGRQAVELKQIAGSQVWEGHFAAPEAGEQPLSLSVVAQETGGGSGEDIIQVEFGSRSTWPSRASRDRDNAIAAWPAHGLLGTQLGPNRNGRKW